MLAALPPRNRAWVRATLVFLWLLVAAGGVGMSFDSPAAVDRTIGDEVTDLAGIGLAIAASVAALGVGINRYRLEWSAAWFSAAAFVPYVFSVWWLVFTSSSSRITQALLMSALLVFFTLRAQFCGAHAAKLRTLHEETGIIDVHG